MTGVIESIGRGVFQGLSSAGRGMLLLRSILLATGHVWKMRREILEQMHVVLVGSMPLVIVTSVFVGAVTAVQAVYQMQAYVPMKFLGTVISKSVFIELGPVLMALVVGSRLCAYYAAELGTMKVTEQVDALEAMAIDPVRFLVLPRFWAATIMLPVITALADVLALGGAYVVALLTVDGMTHHLFMEGVKLNFYMKDLVAGLVKALFFGMIIASSGSFYGLRAGGGAEGVGRATMKAVVANCLMILVLDYFLAAVLFQMIFGGGK